jgi:hypothetical protein
MGSERSDRHKVDPEVAERQARRLREAERRIACQHEADSAGGGGQTQDDRLDEAIEESFPASDPASH